MRKSPFVKVLEQAPPLHSFVPREELMGDNLQTVAWGCAVEVLTPTQSPDGVSALYHPPTHRPS